MRVEGISDVYAAGDSTWFPIKQGGVATQQADTAASTIAAKADPSIAVEPFRPVLRAAIMTGTTPRYLRADVENPDGTSASGAAPLWWPTSKVAGRRLAPFLAGRVDRPDQPPKAFGDLEEVIADDSERAEADHVDAVELALTAADADARWRDYSGALRWLAIAEHLGFTLPPEVAAKRERWRAETEGDQDR
jgi:sulfide:quinone oxidoreductase